MTIEIAKNYLRNMEDKRKKNEKYNQKAYNDARELSALVSLAEFGNKDIYKQAKKAIKIKKTGRR